MLRDGILVPDYHLVARRLSAVTVYQHHSSGRYPLWQRVISRNNKSVSTITRQAGKFLFHGLSTTVSDVIFVWMASASKIFSTH